MSAFLGLKVLSEAGEPPMGKTGCKYSRINTPQECPPPTRNVTLRFVSASFPQVSMWNEASVAHGTDGLTNASLADFLFISVSLAQTKAEADGYGERREVKIKDALLCGLRDSP